MFRTRRLGGLNPAARIPDSESDTVADTTHFKRYTTISWILLPGPAVPTLGPVAHLCRSSSHFLSKIHRFSGASAEAINATLLALEYKVDEVCDILAKLNFNDFKDGIFGIIRDAKRLLLEFSRQKGDFFHDLIGKLIEKKTNQPDSKFADLARQLGSPKLHLVATNLNTRSIEVFSSDTTRKFRPRKPSDDPCLFHFSSL